WLPSRLPFTRRLRQHGGRDHENQNCDEGNNDTARIITIELARHRRPPSRTEAGTVSRGRPFHYERYDLDLPGPKDNQHRQTDAHRDPRSALASRGVQTRWDQLFGEVGRIHTNTNERVLSVKLVTF